MQLTRLKPSMVLMLGQTLALGVSFFVPMLLARQLTTEDFGTYRLVMLLQVLLTIVGSVGFDGGLFRHVRSESYAPAFQGSLSLIWGFLRGARLFLGLVVWPCTRKLTKCARPCSILWTFSYFDSVGNADCTCRAFMYSDRSARAER